LVDIDRGGFGGLVLGGGLGFEEFFIFGFFGSVFDGVMY
jgi:hypothetical protein